MKIRLDKWLEKEFDPPPKIRTARLWINAGKIYPPPVKVGRSYYVEQDAVFADGRTRPTLAERVIAARKARGYDD
ncbi:excisionase [Paraburkholderia sp. BL25I1N1]|uniref:excisionase n=1 Tax=Paraburkholderia sp. BL25I1N1 TaxID=1938804 RepID=UPI000D04B237|nr:excisionase [Paraburkholderia sp. BL25I1N1]PRY07042.1 excisionase-like protein [Paraburkholderia sp. BL25I1N1]